MSFGYKGRPDSNESTQRCLVLGSDLVGRPDLGLCQGASLIRKVHAGGFRSFVGILVARIRKDHLLFTLQQRMALGDIVDVGICCNHGVHQTAMRVHPNIGPHAAVPLVALLSLVHLGVASPLLFSVELGAGVKATVLSNKPWAANLALMTCKIFGLSE